MVCQLEIAPTTGTPHIQGVVVFKNPVRWSSLREAVPCYWAWRRGTQEQAEAYASKSASRAAGDAAGPFEFGDPIASGRGGRSDLVRIKHKLAEGVTLRELAKDDEFTPSVVRHHRGLTFLESIYAPQRRWWTKVQIYWGPPGVGKTRRVHYEAGDDLYVFSCREHSVKYWDGYHGQRYILIDDFNGELTQGQMLELINYTAFSVQVRGAAVPILADKLFVTSNYHPRGWWSHGPNPQELHVGLEARFGLSSDARFSATATEEMTVPWQPTAMQLACRPEPVLYPSRDAAFEALAAARELESARLRESSPVAAPIAVGRLASPLSQSSNLPVSRRSCTGSGRAVRVATAVSRGTPCAFMSRTSFTSWAAQPFCVPAWSARGARCSPMSLSPLLQGTPPLTYVASASRGAMGSVRAVSEMSSTSLPAVAVGDLSLRSQSPLDELYLRSLWEN